MPLHSKSNNPQESYLEEIRRGNKKFLDLDNLFSFFRKTARHNLIFYFLPQIKLDFGMEGIKKHLAYNRLFNQLTYTHNEENIPPEIKETTLRIISDISKIRDTLSILKEIDIDVNIDLLGGAVRDLVLGNHDKIKDLDLVIKLNGPILDSLYSQENKNKLILFLKEQGIDEESDNEIINIKKIINEIECIFEKNDISINDDTVKAGTQRRNDINNYLIKKMIEKKFKVKAIYDYNSLHKSAEESLRSGYEPRDFNTDLGGIIKVEKTGLNYDIDLLNAPKAEHYIGDFDYDICKIYVSGKNIREGDYQLFWKSINCDTGFIASVEEKKLLLDPNCLSVEGLSFSLGERLDRMKGKYPNFVLETMPLIMVEEDEFQQKQKIIEVIKEKNRIDESIDKTKTVKSSLKI